MPLPLFEKDFGVCLPKTLREKSLTFPESTVNYLINLERYLYIQEFISRED